MRKCSHSIFIFYQHLKNIASFAASVVKDEAALLFLRRECTPAGLTVFSPINIHTRELSQCFFVLFFK